MRDLWTLPFPDVTPDEKEWILATNESGFDATVDIGLYRRSDVPFSRHICQ